uniref:TPR_REGION domain-containing protein n=1 Tax=Strongyloides papillosus TaxID=174720 RepID=A0A0N5CDK5_STREA
MIPQNFTRPIPNIRKITINDNETPRRKISISNNIALSRNKNSLLNNSSKYNQKSFSDATRSTCKQKCNNMYLSNMESPSCNLKNITIASLGVCNVKSLLGKATPMVLHNSSVLKNQTIYSKEYKFPRRMWPICKIINNYILQKNKNDQIVDIIEKLLKYVYKDCGFYHRDTAAVLLFCAQVHYKLKFYKTAILSAEKALKVFQHLYGEIHIGCCVTYQLMAMICKAINDKKGSMYSLKKAISILTIIFGQKYLEIAKLHNNIGVLFEEERMFSNAIESYMISQNIFKEQDEVNSMYIYNVEISIIRASYLESLFNKEILQDKIFYLLEQLKKELLLPDQYEMFDSYLIPEQKVNFIIENNQKDIDTNNMLNSLKKLTVYYLRNDEN